jgi:hypothetical protein
MGSLLGSNGIVAGQLSHPCQREENLQEVELIYSDRKTPRLG